MARPSDKKRSSLKIGSFLDCFFIPRQVQACRGICSPAERKTGAPPSQFLAGRASAVFPLPAEGIDESGAGRSMDYPLFAPLHGLPVIASPALLLFPFPRLGFRGDGNSFGIDLEPIHLQSRWRKRIASCFSGINYPRFFYSIITGNSILLLLLQLISSAWADS